MTASNSYPVDDVCDVGLANVLRQVPREVGVVLHLAGLRDEPAERQQVALETRHRVRVVPL